MSKDARTRITTDNADLHRLRAEAWLHDGVVRVPFLGTTWQERGRAYWRRRVGAVALLVVLTLVVGAIATGFTTGIIAGAGGALGITLGTVYALTAVAGFITGRRRAARAPADGSGTAPRTAVPIGCLAFVITPFSAGLVLAVLLSMFGHDFMGDKRARQVAESLHHRG